VDLAIGLQERGIENFVASEGGLFVSHLKRGGVSHFTLPLSTKNPFKIWINSYRLGRLIREHKIQIVHGRSRAPAWSAWLACRRTGATFLTTYHAAYGARGLWYPFKKWYNKIMTKGQHIIAVSFYIGKHIASQYPKAASRVVVIHRGVDCQVFNPENVSAERIIKLAKRWHVAEETCPILMLPARPSRRKGHKDLLLALEKIKSLPFLCLVVGGDLQDEYLLQLQKMTKKKGLGGKVRFVGDCQDMAAAYMLADIVIHSTHYPEAFGRVVAEAQAMGRPVIATEVGGVPEIIQPGETGWLIPPQNPLRLAQTIEEALQLTPASREKLAKKARARILKNFNKETMIKETLALYTKSYGLSS
jgi:glycosyltransferase involved in cell wall biosynthesis